MAVQTQKLKILYLLRILMERTDETHIMTAQELCGTLKSKYGIEAERKSIYSDIETLQAFGVDIVQMKGSNSGYYMGQRDFELPELKLLVDAVQAAKFITQKKTEELISKLEKLTSRYEAEQLQREVYIFNRLKADNETIYYNVDQIHEAISANRQITFQYAEWTVKKELRLKKAGEHYGVSPWKLTWDDENYYLIGFDEEAGCIKHYRVDKMKNLSVLEKKRAGKEAFCDFDLAAFAKRTFGMYGGKDEKVTMLCDNTLAGVIIDRFGKGVIMVPKRDGHFQVVVTVSVSRQFFGWVTGVGGMMKIVSPEKVKEEYRGYLRQILEGYEK